MQRKRHRSATLAAVRAWPLSVALAAMRASAHHAPADGAVDSSWAHPRPLLPGAGDQALADERPSRRRRLLILSLV